MTIEEFNRRLSEMAAKYPADASDVLQKGAKKMVKGIQKGTPDSGKAHKRKLKKSWKMEMVDSFGKAPKAEIRNTSPHFHLVERGVQNPKDFKRKPKPEWKDSLNKHRGFLEKAVKSNWPDVQKQMETEFFGKVRGHLG